MRKFVEAFPEQMEEAIKIGRKAVFTAYKNEIREVLVTGLGGSGIGGTILSQLVAQECNVPILVNKDYDLPNFVGEHTLVIVSSYSGNTEETINACHQAIAKGAMIAAITTGGTIGKIASENKYNQINVPTGYPPRAAFAFSITQLFFVLKNVGLISSAFEGQLESAIALLRAENSNLLKESTRISDVLFGKLPIIYSDPTSEGVAIRFRQQINENSKMLCWHHVFPEMNHNELVGWTTNNDDLAVVFFKNETDNARTAKRMELCEPIFKKHTSHVATITSKGNSAIERAFYMIHLGDLISVELAERKGIDSIEVNVINSLKDALSKF